jgi:hypothetical protein
VSPSPSLGRVPRTRVTWPRCVARARSTGARCRALAVLDTRCWHHGGTTFGAGWRRPKPSWTLSVTPSGVRLHPSRTARGRTPSECKMLAQRWPKRLRPWAAVELVARGRIQCGVFFKAGAALLRAIRARGVSVVVDSTMFGLTSCHFRASSRCESKHPLADGWLRRRLLRLASLGVSRGDAVELLALGRGELDGWIREGLEAPAAKPCGPFAKAYALAEQRRRDVIRLDC